MGDFGLPKLYQFPFNIFDDIAGAFGGVLGGDSVTGGYLAGFITVAVVVFVFVLLTKGESFNIPLFMGVAAVCIIALVGWWPWWTLILLVLMLGYLLIKPHQGE